MRTLRRHTLRRPLAVVALALLLGACRTGFENPEGEGVGSENAIDQPAPNVGRPDIDEPDTGSTGAATEETT